MPIKSIHWDHMSPRFIIGRFQLKKIMWSQEHLEKIKIIEKKDIKRIPRVFLFTIAYGWIFFLQRLTYIMASRDKMHLNALRECYATSVTVTIGKKDLSRALLIQTNENKQTFYLRFSASPEILSQLFWVFLLCDDTWIETALNAFYVINISTATTKGTKKIPVLEMSRKRDEIITLKLGKMSLLNEVGTYRQYNSPLSISPATKCNESRMKIYLLPCYPYTE